MQYVSVSIRIIYNLLGPWALGRFIKTRFVFALIWHIPHYHISLSIEEVRALNANIK